MSALKAGDSFPDGVTFTYVPYNPDQGSVTACGIPIKYDASKGNTLPIVPNINPPSKEERTTDLIY